MCHWIGVSKKALQSALVRNKHLFYLDCLLHVLPRLTTLKCLTKHELVGLLLVRQPLGSTLFWGLKFFFQWILFASIPNLQNILVGSLSALGNLR